jgi:hypothetical protein
LLKEEDGCRYEMSKQVMQQMESCNSQDVMMEIARIATVCHYEKTFRESFLPLECSGHSCLQKMSPEVFGVFSAFFIHAESICRQFSTEAWRISVQKMVEMLGSSSVASLNVLNEVRDQGKIISESQEKMAMAQQFNLEQVTEVNKKLSTQVDMLNVVGDRAREFSQLFEKMDHIAREHEHAIQDIGIKMNNVTGLVSNLNELVLLLTYSTKNGRVSVWMISEMVIFYLLWFYFCKTIKSLLYCDDEVKKQIMRISVLFMASCFHWEMYGIFHEDVFKEVEKCRSNHFFGYGMGMVFTLTFRYFQTTNESLGDKKIQIPISLLTTI